MRLPRIAALLALSGVVASCGGGGDSGPQPGVLAVTLNTPNTGDGAVMFRIVGGPVDSATFPAMVIDGSYSSGSSTSRFALAGPITDGPIAYLYVPDTKAAGNYVGTMEQVAANSNFALRSLTGYSVAVSVVP